MANTTQMDPEELLKQIRQGTTVSSAPDQADPEEILRQVRGASSGQNTTTAAEPGLLETANKYWEPTPAIKPALSWNYAKNLGTRVGEGAMRGALMIPNIAEATREAVVTPPKNAEEQKVSNPLNTDHEPIMGRVILAAKRLAVDPSIEARKHVAEEAAAAKAKLNAMGVKTEGDYDTLDPRAQQVRRAERLGQAVSLIPFVGPMGISMGEHVGKTGDVAGTVSELGTMAVMPEIQKGATDIAGRAVKAAAPVVADVAKNATSPIVRAGAMGVDLALKHPKTTAAILGSAGAAIGLPGHGTIPLVSELAGGALGGALFGKAISPEGGVSESWKNAGLPDLEGSVRTANRDVSAAQKIFEKIDDKVRPRTVETTPGETAKIPESLKNEWDKAKATLEEAKERQNFANSQLDAARQRKAEAKVPMSPEDAQARADAAQGGPLEYPGQNVRAPKTGVKRVGPIGSHRDATAPVEFNEFDHPLGSAKPVNDPLAAMRFQGTLGGDETLPVPPPKGSTVSLEDKAKLREDYNTAKEKRNGVSKKLFVTKADEALLRDLGYTQEQINKLTPQKAGDILTRTETDANSPIVAEQLANVGNESLRRIAKSAGIDPDEYDFKLERGESRHHPDRDRLVAEIVNKMSPEELERHEFGAQDFEHNADQSQAMKKSRAEVLFKHRISGAPLDEFGQPTVSGSAPESDLDRTAEEHTKALFPGQKANVEAQESIPRAVSPEEAQRRADAYATVQYPRGVVPGARVLESSGLNVNPIHEINIGGRTGLVRMSGESGTSEVADQFLHQQYPNENAIVLPRETAGSSVYSPEEINEAANQHLKDYERSSAQHTYEKEPGELVTKHRVTVTDEHGNPIGKVEAVELTSEPGTWRIQSSESKATPGSHVGRDAYKQILDSAKAEAKATGSPITVLGDAVQSPSALATWRALGKEYGPVSTDYDTGRSSITLSPEKSSSIPRVLGELAKQLWEREHGELGKPESVGEPFSESESVETLQKKLKEVEDRRADLHAKSPQSSERIAKETGIRAQSYSDLTPVERRIKASADLRDSVTTKALLRKANPAKSFPESIENIKNGTKIVINSATPEGLQNALADVKKSIRVLRDARAYSQDAISSKFLDRGVELAKAYYKEISSHLKALEDSK